MFLKKSWPVCCSGLLLRRHGPFYTDGQSKPRLSAAAAPVGCSTAGDPQERHGRAPDMVAGAGGKALWDSLRRVNALMEERQKIEAALAQSGELVPVAADSVETCEARFSRLEGPDAVAGHRSTETKMRKRGADRSETPIGGTAATDRFIVTKAGRD